MQYPSVRDCCELPLPVDLWEVEQPPVFERPPPHTSSPLRAHLAGNPDPCPYPRSVGGDFCGGGLPAYTHTHRATTQFPASLAVPTIC